MAKTGLRHCFTVRFRWIGASMAVCVMAASGPLSSAAAQGLPEPSAAEIYMLELVNRARANPQGEAERYGIDLNESLDPGTITADPKQPLAFSRTLLAAARDHSQWMLDENAFSHTGQDGSSQVDRVEAAGYTGWRALAENLAVVSNTDLPGSVDESHEGLFLSSGHRVNTMNPTLREVGIGSLTGDYFWDGYGNFDSRMTTQNFGSLNQSHFITGVVYEDLDEDGFYSIGEGRGGVSVSAGDARTVTGAAGDYALAVSDGSYTVTFSGAALGGQVVKSASVAGANVKLDALAGEAGAAPLVAETGWWWNADQPGRGFSLEVREGRLFFSGYLYEPDGAPVWYISLGDHADGSYAGTLDRYQGGITLNGDMQAATRTGSQGDMTLAFASATSGTLSWPGETVALTRFEFDAEADGLIADPLPGNPQTGWWWNADEAGRGWFIETQGDSLFIAGYMYDAAGDPVWMIALGAMTSPTLFEGTLQEYRGGQCLGCAHSPAVIDAERGAITLGFAGPANGQLTLPNGRVIELERFTAF